MWPGCPSPTEEFYHVVMILYEGGDFNWPGFMIWYISKISDFYHLDKNRWQDILIFKVKRERERGNTNW